MSLVNKSTKTYNSSVAILTSLTVIAGLGTVFLGYIFFPFAAAFFAMLLSCESYGKRRIFSYIAPLIVLLVDVVVNRIFIFEALAFIVIGFLLFFMYSRRAGKSETVFTLIAVLFAFFVVSIIFAIFRINNSFSFGIVADYLKNLYEQYKTTFVDAATYAQSVGLSGQDSLLLSRDDLIDIYNGLVSMIPPALVVTAIVSVGIASKIFTFFVSKFTVDAPFAMRWRLHTSTLLAVVYIIVSILRLFVGAGIFGLCVSWIYVIFSVVYAYIGVKFLYQFISIKKSSLLAVAVIVIAFLFFSTFAYQLSSYFGAYYVISVNRRANLNRHD